MTKDEQKGKLATTYKILQELQLQPSKHNLNILKFCLDAIETVFQSLDEAEEKEETEEAEVKEVVSD